MPTLTMIPSLRVLTLAGIYLTESRQLSLVWAMLGKGQMQPSSPRFPNSPESRFSPSNIGPTRVLLSKTQNRGSSALRHCGQLLYPRRPTKLTKRTALAPPS